MVCGTSISTYHSAGKPRRGFGEWESCVYGSSAGRWFRVGITGKDSWMRSLVVIISYEQFCN